MRQSQCFFLALLLVVSSVIVGCGGGGSSSSTPGTPTITVSPTSLSLNFGQFVQLTPTMLDGSGKQVFTPTPVFSSNNANLAVSTNGLVCAGTWNSLTTPTVCTPTNVAITNGTITVTAGSLTATIPVSIHTRIARVTLTTTAGCTSQNATQQFTAHAFDSINPTVELTSPGTFNYTTSDATVGTIDAATGLVTSKLPGSASISASINGVFSVPATFLACQPASISLTPTSFTGAAAATQQLTFAVTDTAGNPITGLALTYSSSQPTVASVSSTGLITNVAAGNTGIVASCTPPSCNPGAAASVPVYSNVVGTTVTGTSSTTVYVTGATATSIIPIDTTTNTAGTAITIPLINSVQPKINSMVFNKAGSTAFIGTDQGIIPLTPDTNAFGTPIAIPAVVLAVSPDGKKIIIADQTATPHTYVIDTTNSGVTTLGITTVSTAADFSADSLKAYIVSNGSSKLSVYSSALPFQTVDLNAAANDVTFLSQGSLAYFAGGAVNSITAHSTCDNHVLTNPVATTSTPLLIKSNFNSTRVFSVDGSRMYDVAVSNIALPANANCPVTATNALTTVSFGSAFTPRQMIMTSDGAHVFVTNNLSKLMVYNATNSTTSAITLLNGGTSTTTGGATLDSTKVYVGATGSNDVHRIDVAAGTDAQQIAVGLKDASGAAVSPDFVVVRPK